MPPPLPSWSPDQLEHFSHKLEEIIHGGNVDGSVGFVLVTYPIRDSARAKLMSNSDRGMVIEVLYQVLKGLVAKQEGLQ